VALRSPETLVHGDLAARHVTTCDGRVTGVVDWTRARVADPATDLAWPLYGTPEPVAEAVARAYAVSDDELGRALDRHRLGPWYDVLWGLGAGGPAFVESGLRELVIRLDIKKTA
jgi:aminoglycoside phosphotransferase (APT) family kinase protein